MSSWFRIIHTSRRTHQTFIGFFFHEIERLLGEWHKLGREKVINFLNQLELVFPQTAVNPNCYQLSQYGQSTVNRNGNIFSIFLSFYVSMDQITKRFCNCDCHKKKVLQKFYLLVGSLNLCSHIQTISFIAFVIYLFFYCSLNRYPLHAAP